MKQLGFEELANTPSAPKVWTVSELVSAASREIETRFGDLWVEGEISNFNQHRSGHVYFTLKEPSAQLDAVLWRSDARRLKFRLEDGLRVQCHGHLSIYAERGRFQMYVDRVEPKGLGELQLAFEQMKARLAAEGLFDTARKRPLPFLPRVIGLVTSPSGAAVRDFIRVATRRYPARILVAPAAVQGDEAPMEIVRALAWLEARAEVEVIVLTRGGGSIEDLWAFNDERVARAIAATRTPVISAVGHEVDYTIADFVADLRAPTPSAAAELVVPEHAALAQALAMLGGRLGRATRHCVREARQRLDDSLVRAERSLTRQTECRRQRLATLQTRLASAHPRGRLRMDRARLDALMFRLRVAGQTELATRRARLGATAAKLDALSPLRVLDRGYALVRTPDGMLVVEAGKLAPGDALRLRLREGEVDCRVEKVWGPNSG